MCTRPIGQGGFTNHLLAGMILQEHHGKLKDPLGCGEILEIQSHVLHDSGWGGGSRLRKCYFVPRKLRGLY